LHSLKIQVVANLNSYFEYNNVNYIIKLLMKV